MSITLHSINQPYSNETWTSEAVSLLVQITAKHGALIRKLVLKNAEFENITDFYNVLSRMPLLHELVLIRIKFDVAEHTNNEKQIWHINLNNLNKLSVNTCDWNIFQFFMTSPIKELKITNRFALVDAQQKETFMQFLQASTKLEFMEFDFMSYAKTFQTPMDREFGFKLKRLKYLSFSPSYDIHDIHKNFGTFIESQSSSLTELELNYVAPNIIMIIFTKLQNLEKLRLNASVLPNNTEFYIPFKKMQLLKELTLHDDIASEGAIKQVLLNCYNLETLTAHHDPHHYITNLLTFMAANNPMMKRLSIDTLPVEILPEMKFNHLKFLDIQTCNGLDNVVKFLHNNPVIETLSFNMPGEFIAPDDAVVADLINKTNLQHLIIEGDDNALSMMYNKINVNYRKLKSLELRSPSTQAGNKVLIKFCNYTSGSRPKDIFFQ